MNGAYQNAATRHKAYVNVIMTIFMVNAHKVMLLKCLKSLTQNLHETHIQHVTVLKFFTKMCIVFNALSKLNDTISPRG